MRFLQRGEIQLLALTIVFQLISMFTLFRVATGVASITPGQNTTATTPIVVPSNITSGIVIPDSTPQFVNPAGNSLDASFVLALLFIGANVVVIGFLAYLYRKKKMQWFSLLVSLFLVFNVTELYVSFLAGLYSYVPIVAAVAGLAITLFAAFKGVSWVTNALALLLALELGSSFPVLLQAPLSWIIPGVYAVFDVYAVYYGRMGKLVKQVSSASESGAQSASSELPAKKGSQTKRTGRLQKWPEFGLLAIRLRDFEIGMADIAFYTMVPAVALVLNSLLAFFVVMAAVDAGVVLSFTVFRKREVSPGLPIPILSGLGALLIMSLLI